MEIRERFSVPSHRLQNAGKSIRELPGVEQCVVLSTCNRMEIYYWSDNPENAREHILSHFLGDGRGKVDMASHFYCHQGAFALEHLCRVLSGLDSMVLGETEIFGQVKTAYQMALDGRRDRRLRQQNLSESIHHRQAGPGRTARFMREPHPWAPWPWNWRNKSSETWEAPAF